MSKAAVCCTTLNYPDRGTIHRDSGTADDPQPVYTGAAFKTGVPCNVRTISGDETYRGRQLDATVNHVVEMPYVHGVETSMRLTITTGIYRNRVMHIAHVRPMRITGKPPTLELYCSELL